MRRIALLALSLVVVSGCSSKPPPETKDAGAAQLGPVDAGAPVPEAFRVDVQFATDAGLQTVEFLPGDKPIVPQADRVEVLLNQRISNYRVRLFDEADKAVPSDDTPDEGANAIRYVIGLQAPLKTGYRYALVLDAQTGAAMLDPAGKPMSDVRLEFKVAGEKEKPAPPPKKKAPSGKKKRR